MGLMDLPILILDQRDLVVSPISNSGSMEKFGAALSFL